MSIKVTSNPQVLILILTSKHLGIKNRHRSEPEIMVAVEALVDA